MSNYDITPEKPGRPTSTIQLVCEYVISPDEDNSCHLVFMSTKAKDCLQWENLVAASQFTVVAGAGDHRQSYSLGIGDFVPSYPGQCYEQAQAGRFHLWPMFFPDFEVSGSRLMIGSGVLQMDYLLSSSTELELEVVQRPLPPADQGYPPRVVLVCEYDEKPNEVNNCYPSLEIRRWADCQNLNLQSLTGDNFVVTIGTRSNAKRHESRGSTPVDHSTRCVLTTQYEGSYRWWFFDPGFIQVAGSDLDRGVIGITIPTQPPLDLGGVELVRQKAQPVLEYRTLIPVATDSRPRSQGHCVWPGPGPARLIVRRDGAES